jgi:hypothetical protein
MRIPTDRDGKRDFAAWGALISFLGEGDWRVTERLGLEVPTPDGMAIAEPGEWIIRDAKGDLYRCPDDMFTERYEPAA